MVEVSPAAAYAEGWTKDASWATILTWNGSTSTAQSNPSGAQSLVDVDCPNTTSCFATGFIGAVVAGTFSGGTWTWSSEKAQTNYDLFGLSCITVSSTLHCIAVDNAGGVLHRKHPGDPAAAYDWKQLQTGTTNPAGPPAIVQSGLTNTLANPSSAPNNALQAGDDLKTYLSGPQPAYYVAPDSFNAVSCSPFNTTCEAVGYRALIARSGNAHSTSPTWTDQMWANGTTTPDFNSVSCTNSTCRAVGDAGYIIGK